jgi:hypothetical protein
MSGDGVVSCAAEVAPAVPGDADVQASTHSCAWWAAHRTHDRPPADEDALVTATRSPLPTQTLLDEADVLLDRLPGCRVEIIGGILTVTPLPDGDHANTVTGITRSFFAAGRTAKDQR